MPNLDNDWSFGNSFLPVVKSIIGPHLLAVAPLQVDQKRAADLIVLRAEPVEIGMTIRRPGYGDRYPHDFTIRAKRDTGTTTELEKACNGFMTWKFYGHAGDQPGELAHWMLIDMRVWRREIMRVGWQSAKQSGMVVERSNGDGTHFIACDVRKYPSDLLIDRKVSDG